MVGHLARTAVTLCAAAALAAPLGTASAAPSADRDPTPRHRTPQPVLIDCAQRPEVRPEAFIIACGDGNSVLTSLQWSRWDARAAVATGVNDVNDCDPDCAAGTFLAYPVTVRLDRARVAEQDAGQTRFTRLSLTYTDGRPDGYPAVVTYPLPG
ncbi:hypothetical protein [Streptomyces tagetis]|uniref:Secreted protein n=1 Tax=Streptomyces tagetis TaxID=2820809 RepID=A0A941B072_9ACTN|nr:hypothetical protein [Streptomyces sp. RG38]MBQ0826361.1 hypothetical protein [Streptomyces sp. RG38]